MLIPYFEIPSLPPHSSIAIHPFGVLVATGILVGAWLTRRRGAKLGLDDEMVRSMIFWSVASGLVLCHVVDVLLYQSWNNWDTIVEHWDGAFAACFNPRHGIRVKAKDAVFDFVICFECNSVAVFRNEKRTGSFGITGQPGALNRLLTAAKNLADKGISPPGIDSAHQKVRSAAIILPPGQPFKEVPRETFVARPSAAPVSV